MIYLFNKVHLKPLALFDNNNKISRIIIGNNCTQVNDTSEKILIEQMYGELLFSEKDYSILIEKHFNNSDSSFISWLLHFNPDVRLELYVNNLDFLNFLIRWYKTFLINITPETAYFIFKLIYNRANNILGMPYTSQSYFTNNDERVCTELAKTIPDKDTFISKWNDSIIFDICDEEKKKIIQSFAIEFQIPTIELHNGNYQYCSANKKKIVNMAKKWHITMLMDTKSMSLIRLSLLPDFDVQKDTIREWVKRHPEYKFLDDSNFHEDNFEYIHNTYDIAELTKTYIAQMQRFEYQNVERIVSDFHFFKTNLTYEEVMDAEIKSIYDRQILTRWEYNNHINVYILDVVLNAIRNNDKNLLTELSVL